MSVRHRVLRPWLLGALLSALSLPLGAEAERRFLLIVSGLGGEAYYSELFARWSGDLLAVAHRKYRLDDAHTLYLAEPAAADGVADGVADKPAVLDAVARIAAGSMPGDRVLIVLIGHGTAQGPVARFNLPGPDLTAGELAAALTALSGRRLAIVNTTPASAAFVRALSAPGRIVITATASSAESQHTRFAGFFVGALADAAADTDKDQQISLLEAFNYANREVERAYAAENRLRVEHAQLDDNGDLEASREPAASTAGGADGALARRYSLAPALAARFEGEAVLALQLEASRLLDAIERLKRDKTSYAEADYERRLEDLLVSLALNRRRLRAEQAT